ncbi:MAG: alkyl sulfatase C-terminal domain-containing protein [Candidatus Hodarchaeota archaeon]
MSAHAVEIRCGVAQFHITPPEKIDATVLAKKSDMDLLAVKAITLEQAVNGGKASIQGDKEIAKNFFKLFEKPTAWKDMGLTIR